MSIPIRVYTEGTGAATIPGIISLAAAPSATTTGYNPGQIAVVPSTNTAYILTSKTTSNGVVTANWTVISTAAGDVDSLTTQDSTIVVPTAGNINISGANTITTTGSGSTVTINPTASGYPVTPYVVGASGKAGYQTIQAAINAANSAGGGTVYIQAGTYTENLTMHAGVDLVGAIGASNDQSCQIAGVHVPNTSGQSSIRGVYLTSATHIFSSATAGTGSVAIKDCVVNCTNGYTFNVANWTAGTFGIYTCGDVSTNNGVFNNTGGASALFSESTIGAGTGNTLTTSGTINIYNCAVGCPVSFGSGSTVYVNAGADFTHTVTLAGTSTGSITNCAFETGATAAVTMSSSAAWALSDCSINSSNNPAIAGSGAGTLTLAGLTFLSNSATAGTLTLAWGDSKSGATSVTGNLTFSTAGNKIISTSVATTTTGGANSFGSVTLSSGTATVATSAVTASSLINIWRQGVGASTALGELTVGAISAGTNFVISAATQGTPGTPLATDASSVGWMIIN